MLSSLLQDQRLDLVQWCLVASIEVVVIAAGVRSNPGCGSDRQPNSPRRWRLSPNERITKEYFFRAQVMQQIRDAVSAECFRGILSLTLRRSRLSGMRTEKGNGCSAKA